MSKLKFSVLCIIVFVSSILTSIIFGGNDKMALFIASVGAFGTIATLYVAFEIFVTYNAPADIQKKQFELVDKALAFFITKRFFLMTDNEHTYFLYFTKQRLTNCLQGLYMDSLSNQPPIVSMDFFQYLMDFQSQLEHHYFPFKLKMTILSNLPQGLTMISGNNFKDKIRIAFSNEDGGYGYPMMTNEAVDIHGFINSMSTIRIAMIDYLNDNVPYKYQIIDENV